MARRYGKPRPTYRRPRGPSRRNFSGRRAPLMRYRKIGYRL